MVKHIVLWDLKDELTAAEKKEAAQKIKSGLEALSDLSGAVSIKVYLEPVISSNCDIMLDSSFENEESLKLYIANPRHIAVRDFINSVIKNRKCFDGSK